jgi:2-hydroxy-3-keto-5-methylthiopentenyl-1-phosphate phosphatase
MEIGRPVVDAVVVDFDGTICPADVSDELLVAFAGEEAERIDREYEAGLIGSRECLERQVALLSARVQEMTARAVERFALDPSFPAFARWCRAMTLPLLVVSDGLGFHIRPMLDAAGVDPVAVITNETIEGDQGSAMRFPNGHPVCRQCGTCKMRAVLAARERFGRVAFVGDGHSDRYGALYADLVFAKGILADHCRTEAIPHHEWESFHDVRTWLEAPEPPPGAVDPERCPGWREPAPS